MKDIVNIDGAIGEGGGQVLRTSLALSLVTGTPFHISNIRAGRKNPGLLRQHLTAVKAAAEISAATVNRGRDQRPGDRILPVQRRSRGVLFFNRHCRKRHAGPPDNIAWAHSRDR